MATLSKTNFWALYINPWRINFPLRDGICSSAVLDNPSKWPSNWRTGLITPIKWSYGPLTTGDRCGPLCGAEILQPSGTEASINHVVSPLSEVPQKRLGDACGARAAPICETVKLVISKTYTVVKADD